MKDVIQANIAAMERGHQETMQVSTARRTSVNSLSKILSDIHGSKIDTVRTSARKGDIQHSCLDNRKASKLLHWKPKVDIVQGLTETYSFINNSKF